METLSKDTNASKPRLTAGPWRSERLVAAVGAAIGLSILGDSLLYSILPLEAERLGISLPLVGILLSINRLIRLVSNTWVSTLFERVGPRRPFAAATAIALVTTAIYGVGWGFLAFLLSRIGWGIAWSGLRQGGYQAIWSGDKTTRGRQMGILWGIVRLGSALSVVVGGYLWDQFGYRVSVGAVTLATALALPVALTIRWPNAPSQTAVVHQPALHGWKTSLGTRSRRWLLIAGFLHNTLEGILESTASLFLVSRLGTGDLLVGPGVGVATVTGILLAVRWTSNLLFSPVAGALSDRLGQPRTAALLVCTLLTGIVGAAALPGLLPVLCLALAFVAAAGLFVTLSATASGVAARSERPHLFVGAYTTATDAGLATGPLLAYSVGGIASLTTLYLAAGSVLAAAVLRYWRLEKAGV